MIYLDTVFCVYLVEHEGERGGRARELVDSEEVFAISPLVLMECLVKPLRESDLRLEDDYRQTLDELKLLEISPATYERAARLRASAGVRTPDAIHWATAATHGCAEIWTGDATFAAKSSGFAVDRFAGLP
ncbi:MAG: PIN domain-containing protein [Bifidobacteriaceae bacterium]|jgi:predicted nucleic acid-binding protein|nr:PIN domain-containing protein [Bifidobacteriaceae bacterium]